MEARRSVLQIPEHPASSADFGSCVNAPGHWLTAAGLAMEVADHFLHRS